MDRRAAEGPALLPAQLAQMWSCNTTRALSGMPACCRHLGNLPHGGQQTGQRLSGRPTEGEHWMTRVAVAITATVSLTSAILGAAAPGAYAGEAGGALASPRARASPVW